MHTNVEATRRPPHFASSKFAPPGLVSCLVPRQRLFDVLDSGASRHLTLVVGSPGAGKTTLLANWFAARPDRPAAWLACDSSDSDPLRFVAGLIDAMRRGFGDPDVGESALQLLDLDGEVSMDLLAVLTDDLEGHPGERVLVIDDFHLAGGSDTALADFLQSRPPSLHVVVASRSEPQLRLHRMRTRDELVELRDHDLAFSVEETDDYLSALGLDLPDHDVSVINERTEGWSTGVQMVAISLRTSPDPLASVRWSDVKAHAISGYFVEEVLSRQPESVVDFMLATSVLEELSIPACTALVGEGAAAMLEYLCASHLFVTVSDESERTYRYHQLIRGVLQDELHTRDPQHEVQLHEAAARHLLHAGRAASAARHLLAAGDADGAFNLLSDNVVRDVLTNPTTSSVLDFDEFRPELFRGIPSVLIPLAAELLWRGVF
jgi:LuxR family maltose regulon positive regulatory protein